MKRLLRRTAVVNIALIVVVMLPEAKHFEAVRATFERKAGCPFMRELLFRFKKKT